MPMFTCYLRVQVYDLVRCQKFSSEDAHSVIIVLHSYAEFYWLHLPGSVFFNTRGCLCTLGIRPSPMARLIALAILRWFTGRNPV